MLTARWWTDSVPHLAEARCARCGQALMSATGEPWVRALTLPVTTAFPTAADRYVEKTGILEPSAYIKEQWKLYQQREAAKAREGVSFRKRFVPGPHHKRTLLNRYLPLDQLPEDERWPGVVGKYEHAGRPLYDIRLPADIRCVRCNWPSTVNPLTDLP